jgi:hypothetical protein
MQIKIFQIYYKEEQKQFLDPAFIPFDNSNPRFPGKFEIGVFLSEYGHLDFESELLVGFVSWKFNQKAKLKGAEFLHFIEKNPGYDVYFVNPFPELAAFSSVWDQGEVFHPGLKSMSAELFAQASSTSQSLDSPQAATTIAFCNYWVGNQRFWDYYFQIIQSVDNEYNLLDANSMLKQAIDRPADPVIIANAYPFIFERIFSTVISNQVKIKPIGYQYTPLQLLTKMNPLFFILLHAGSLGRRLLKMLISRRA